MALASSELMEDRAWAVVVEGCALFMTLYLFVLNPRKGVGSFADPVAGFYKRRKSGQPLMKWFTRPSFRTGWRPDK
jgi:hypothetical protein